jgi:hypothetical protein
MAKTHINIFLFVLQLVYVNTVISLFIFNYGNLFALYSVLIYLFLVPALLLGIFMLIIKKYIKAYSTYRDLILITLSASGLSLWLPMLIAIFTGPQEYGHLLQSKQAFNIDIRDIPQNADAIWMTFNNGMLLYDMKGEYHETETLTINDSVENVVNSYYAYPLVSEQWTFDEPIMVFFCEKATNTKENIENWNLPYLIQSTSDFTKSGGKIIRDPEEIRIYSRALLKLEKTKEIKISPNAIFINPIDDYDEYYKKSRISFYIFYILVNILWVGTTGLALWLNRRKTIQYVNFDIMK